VALAVIAGNRILSLVAAQKNNCDIAIFIASDF
jgi:hypothetical protein